MSKEEARKLAYKFCADCIIPVGLDSPVKEEVEKIRKAMRLASLIELTEMAES
jgi:hypothetical protein